MTSPVIAIFKNGNTKYFDSEVQAAKELNISSSHIGEVADGKSKRRSVKGYRFRRPSTDEAIAAQALCTETVYGNKIDGNSHNETKTYIRKVTCWAIIHCNCSKAFEFDYDYVKSHLARNKSAVDLYCPHCNSKIRVVLDPSSSVPLDNYFSFRYTNE